MSAEDPSFWKDAVGWVAAGAATLIGAVWGENKYRMAKLEEKIGQKADKDELDRQRDHIGELFRENADLRKDMNGGLHRITELIHSGQVQILTELAKKADR